MILLSGPTGSGKSTTLYAALRHRLAHHPGRIITVEDPVEFDIVGVAQIEVDTADKVRFDTVLRNILRSDPDVIMIGEIRDFDSADVAIKAALTGPPGVQLDPHEFGGRRGHALHRHGPAAVPGGGHAETVHRTAAGPAIVPALPPTARIDGGRGGGHRPTRGDRCARFTSRKVATSCNERGYRGRIGLFELLPIDDDLARRIVEGCDEASLTRRRAS